jgi:hypothetical protein
MSINKDYDRFGYQTPEKKVKVMEEPLAPYKKKLRNYTKTKKIKDDKIHDLILFDSLNKHFYRYSVFIDG